MSWQTVPQTINNDDYDDDDAIAASTTIMATSHLRRN